MLKQLVNECLITLQIEPDGPILIKSGIETVSGPDMAFVRVWRNGDEEIYLPGSSLKGVMRSHAERIARTLQPTAACNPFAPANSPGAFCGSIFDQRKKQNALPDPQDQADQVNRLVYRESCPICKLFGSTWFAGRLATADACAECPRRDPSERDGVVLTRHTGRRGAGKSEFDLEVITAGVFVTTLHCATSSSGRLSMLGFLLEDLRDGLIRIGAAKSRGLGKVRGKMRQVQLHFLGPQSPRPAAGQLELRGMGALADVAAYGAVADDRITVPFIESTATWRSNGLRSVATWDGETFPWALVGPRWVTYAEAYRDALAMAHLRGGGGHGR